MRSKPSIRMPHSSFIVKSNGPIMWSRSWARSHVAAESSSGGRPSGASSSSMKPKIPRRWRWNALKFSSYWALIRPTTRPSRQARNSCASPCENSGFCARIRNGWRSRRSGGTHTSELECSRYGRFTNSRRSRQDETGRTTTLTEADPSNMPPAIEVFAKVRDHELSEELRAARESDVLPYFRRLEGPAGPVVEMEGAERIMLGSNNYLGVPADPRVEQAAREALEKYGTALTGSRLLNGTLDLHLQLEAELAAWMGTEEAIVFSTGHQANVGTLGTILAPGDTVIADTGDHASILDGCLISRAKLRPFKHDRLDKLEKMLQRAAQDGGGVLVVVDGVFSMEGDIAPLPQIVELCKAYGARLMVDEAHGAGVLGARGAGASELFGVESSVDLRMGTFSKSLASCGGFIAGPHEVIDFLRVSSRAFLFTASGVPAAVGAALAALRIIRSPEGPA